MPSVIVAKIMEKLREHERESSSAASPPHASTNTDRNKFSRVARNVLTKIKSVNKIYMHNLICTYYCLLYLKVELEPSLAVLELEEMLAFQAKLEPRNICK